MEKRGVTNLGKADLPSCTTTSANKAGWVCGGSWIMKEGRWHLWHTGNVRHGLPERCCQKWQLPRAWWRWFCLLMHCLALCKNPFFASLSTLQYPFNSASWLVPNMSTYLWDPNQASPSFVLSLCQNDVFWKHTSKWRYVQYPVWYDVDLLGWTWTLLEISPTSKTSSTKHLSHPLLTTQ